MSNWHSGSADSPAPYDHYDESDALNHTPDPFGGDDGCARLANAIKVLKAQIEWRKKDLNPLSSSYNGHVARIAILIAALRKLEAAHKDICECEKK